MVPFSGELEIDATVLQALRVHPVSEAHGTEQLDGPGFE